MPLVTSPRSVGINESLINHNALLNWIANKHIDHSTISITGAGLLVGQGGDITASRVFTINNSDIDHNNLNNTHNLTTDINHDTLLNWVANKHIDHSTISITGAGLLAGQGGDITANRIFTLNNSDVDHDAITNTHNLTTDINHNTILNNHNLTSDISHLTISDIGSNTHIQIDTHLGLTNEHIDWTNASDNFLTSGTLGSGDATINGKVLIDGNDPELGLFRKDGDTGDIFIIDSSGNNILIGDRVTPALTRLEWRDRYSPADTTTGIEWSTSGHKIVQDAIAWEYKATFFGFSTPAPMNFLVQASPSGFSFSACYNDAKSSYLPVGIIMKGYGNTDNLLGTWYFNVDDSTGDLSFRYAYSGSNILIFDNTTKNLKIPDGVDFILGTTTGTKIGTATTQKLGFFNATPVTQRLKANYNNWAAFTDVVDALVDLGLFDQT